jgi:hypothetical protein
MLAEAGVAADSVDAIRSLIDDYNNAEMAALEYKIKELEYQNMSETQKMELERLKQDIKLGNISASQAERRLKLQEEQFNLDKQMQLTETERTEYNNYVNLVDSSSFVYQNANGETVVKEGSESKLRDYIIGLFPDDEEGKYDNLVDTLLLRYGLPINENEK